MEEFYEKAKGVIVLVIRHNGSTFDYINGYKNNNYFARWTEIIPVMKVGHFYGVGCTIKDNNGRTSLTPFGVVYEFPNEQAAKEFSFNVKQFVEQGQWDGQIELQFLKEKAIDFLLEWVGKKIAILEK